MLTYEYMCLNCPYVGEISQKITEKPIVYCPECREATLKRIINGGKNFVLQGSGWAKDGYK